MYKPGDTVWGEFTTTRFDTGAATDGDSLPVGTVNQNGTDDGTVSVTVTKIDTGRYKFTFTIPTTYVLNDTVTCTIAATVNSVAGKGVVFAARLDTSLAQTIGKAQAGAAGTITLASAASATDSLYVGAVVQILSGTGAGQARTITAYNGTSKVATVGRNWVTNPDSTSVYVVNGLSVPRVDDNLSVTIQSGTSTGQLDFTSGVVKANLAQILGTALTESGAGRLVAAFKKLFDVATPTAQADLLPLNTDYTSARAAKLDNLDAAVSTRSTLTATGVWDALLTGISTVGSIGKLIKDYLDAAVSSRMEATPTPFDSNVVGWNGAAVANALHDGAIPAHDAADLTDGFGQITLASAGTVRLAYNSTKYVGLLCAIIGGQGAGQVRKLTGFVGNDFTVSPDWDTIPDGSSYYVLLSDGQATATVDPAGVWNYTPRTLTQGAASVADTVAGSTITVYRGTSWSISITGLGTLTGYTKLWFTVKDGANKPDSQALVQIAKYSSGSGDGLLYLNAAAASDATKGSITIDDAALGNITIALDEAVSKLLVPASNLNYDIKVLNGGNVSELADGTSKFNIRADYTRTIS